MISSNDNIVNNLPYKLKKEKNIDSIYEYFNKLSNRHRNFSLLFLFIGLGHMALFILSIFGDGYSFSTIHTIMLVLQMLLFPFLSYQYYTMSKKMRLTKEELVALLNK